MAANRLPKLYVENARIVLKNFMGSKFGEGGERTFSILLEEGNMYYLHMNGDKADFEPIDIQRLIDDGWKVREDKYYNRDDEYAEEHPKMLLRDIKVRFKGDWRDPKIVMVREHDEVELGPEDLGLLDKNRIEDVTVSINPYVWFDKSNNPGGVSAYLENMRFTKSVDGFSAFMNRNRG